MRRRTYQVSMSGQRQDTHRAINDFLIPSIVVDVDCDAAQCSDFTGKFVELGVVLTFAFVGFGHGNGSGNRSFKLL